MFNPQTLQDTKEFTCSEALEAGSTRSNLQGGETSQFGVEVARVNLGLMREKEKDMRMRETYGQRCCALSSSASLSVSLESRLVANLDVNGSPEYKLTWKSWVLSSGLRICALRASPRRISDKDFSGWPTPSYSDANGGKGPRLGVSPTGKLPDGGKAQMDLSAFAKLQLAGWATPAARD